MPTIILSYRREDTAWIAGRVHDRLKSHFGEDNVFMDIDSIPFGLDFREHIQDSLDRCDILVAIIGPHWATPDGSGKLRLSDETDWVRIEIEAALAKKIPVIPVLIDGTTLPPPPELPEGLRNLAFRQAAPVDSGRDFHPHMDRLIKAMDRLLERPKKKEDDNTQRASAEGGKIATARTGVGTDKTDSSGQIAGDATKIKVTGASTATESAKPSSSVPARIGAALFSANGRMTRNLFLGIVLTTYALMMATAVALGLLWENLSGTPLHDMPPISFLAVLLWLWIVAAVGSKRLHDGDRPGYWVAFPIVLGSIIAVAIAAANESAVTILPAAGFVVLLMLPLCLLKGTPGPNRYGPDPASQVNPKPAP